MAGGDGRQNDANFNSDVWHTKMFNNSNGYKTTKANQLSGGNKLIKGLNKLIALLKEKEEWIMEVNETK